MTKFHVDLGDPPVEEMPPPPPGKLGRARAFKAFKSLKKAVRYANYEYEEGRISERVIVDDNGDPVNIDWNGPEWMTHEELQKKLIYAEAALNSQRDRADKMQEESAKRDNDLIKAGYIPVRSLAPHLVDIVIHRDGGGSENAFFPRDFAMMPHPIETTYRVVFRQFATKVGAEQHPLITAMQAIAERTTQK